MASAWYSASDAGVSESADRSVNFTHWHWPLHGTVSGAGALLLDSKLASSSICNGLLERNSAHADASGYEQSLKQS